MKTFKQFLNEQHVITNIRLTHHQKRVLAIMLDTEDASAHDEEISGDANMAKAREILTNLKMIGPTEGDQYEVTELGKETAEKEGITADGQLTDDGQTLATDNAKAPPSGKPTQAGPSDEPAGDMPGLDVADGSDQLPESHYNGDLLKKMFLTARSRRS